MSADFTEALKEGIANGILEEFGEEYGVSYELSPQELIEKTFYIRLQSSTRTAGLGNRYTTRDLFEISYYVKEAAATEYNRVSARLFECLEYIKENENLVRGEEMKNEVQDGVLHFFVQYQLHLMKEVTKEDCFETMKITEGVK